MAISKIKSDSIDSIDAAKVPNLDASKITTGTVDNARITLDAAEVPNLDASKITAGTVADARFPATLPAASAANLTSIPSANLSGALPAISGASLTNLPASGKTITESTSDPVITTNPSDGVGALHLNKSSADLWCCTDATTNENIWANVSGTGEVAPLSQAQGSIAGYAFGGYQTNIISKFTFASHGNSTDVGDLTASRYSGAGCCSSTDGFCAGGYNSQTTIDKHNFSSGGNGADHGDLHTGGYVMQGFSATSDGFVTGGVSNQTRIQKFAYSSNTTGTDMGDLGTGARLASVGCCSSTDGHTVGGNTSNTNKIQKFSFSNSNNSTDFGTLTNATRAFGSNSRTDGYAAGGTSSIDDIDKFSFSSGGAASAWGTLPTNLDSASSCSSGTHGYTQGGYTGSHILDVYNYPFASNSGGVNVGSLSPVRSTGTGGNSDIAGGQH